MVLRGSSTVVRLKISAHASLIDFTLFLVLFQLLLLFGIGLQELVMKLIDTWHSVRLAGLHVLLAQLLRCALLTGAVEECANVHLVAAGSVTFHTLVLVGMIKSLDRRVTLAAFQSSRALVPADAVL